MALQSTPIKVLLLITIGICFAWNTSATVAKEVGEIVLKAPNGARVTEYNGQLLASSRRVIINPPIKAGSASESHDSALICGFKLHMLRTSSGTELPVEARLLSAADGTAELIVKQHVKFNPADINSAYYEFDISAFDCDNPQHESERVPVRLLLSNRTLTPFAKRHFAIEVTSGTPDKAKLVSVANGNPVASGLCKLKIASSWPDLAPFAIDADGWLVTTASIQRWPDHYELKLAAVACDADASVSTATVKARVVPPSAADDKTQLSGHDSRGEADNEEEEVCYTTWHALPSSLRYTVGSGARAFANSSWLPGCQLRRRQCQQREATVKITASSSDWPEDCDRSAASLQDQRRLCQLHPESVDLLNPHFASDSGAGCSRLASGARPRSHAAAGGDTQFYLDVGPDTLPEGHTLGQEFTLHFWLKRDRFVDDLKEQILCSADENGTAHNRHHYSAFVHNCRLILLLRREAQPGEAAADSAHLSLQAAEWRYSIGELCDNKWHHYAISHTASAAGGKVRLHIDGRLFPNTHTNPQILDDYPMHRVHNAAPNTRLTVGACWHSAQGKYTQFLRASLAGLVLLRGRQESDTVLHCLTQCHEKLDFRAISQLEPGMSVSLNADYTMIEIRGHNVTEVTKLLRQIGYATARRDFDAKAARSVAMATKVSCSDPKAKMLVADARIKVELSPAPAAANSQPAGSLCLMMQSASSKEIEVEEEQLATDLGVAPLSGLSIVPSGQARDLLLDACILSSSPAYSPVESITWPAAAAADAGLVGRVQTNRLILEGFADASTYSRLLSGITYRNRHALIGHRLFSLTCSVTGGRVISNQLSVTLKIKPSKPRRIVKKVLEYQPTDPSTVAPSAPPRSSPASPIPASHARHQEKAAAPHFARSHHAAVSGPQLHTSEAGAANSHSADLGPLAIAGLVGIVALAAVGLAVRRYRAYGSALEAEAAAAAPGNGGEYSRTAASKGLHLPDAELEWDNAGLNIIVNPLERQDQLSDSGSELQYDDEVEDDYGEEDLEMDASSSCPEDEEEDEEEEAGDGAMHRRAQIASSEDELEDEVSITMAPAAQVRYQHQQQHQQQQLEWDYSSLPKC